ncbi:hypothetical protein [Portibacter lacus]|uniref:Outer membrane protein beta-barrel domain-containing protein n=1 Tax=Portibacter lacus TaxID=1099794 RepID=A0AA37WEW3_9BACT|nr:hypothetical protein [Portibacter lacus]GLR19226.1 hypothetical protein GCM10007940_38420 [Portibacter lacus]
MYKHVIILLLVLGFLTSIKAQRFSLITEIGGLKTQVDGDKIQGFYYNGYTAGIGTNYAFNAENFLSVKTAYYDQGSRVKNKYEPKPVEGFQLALDFSTVGLEVSYKFQPYSKKYYLGIGAVHHQIISFEYGIVEEKAREFDRNLSSDQLRGSFNSIKAYYGYELFDRASLYFATQISTTNLMKSNFHQIKSLVPYSIELVFSYEIFATKNDKFKSRPGSKSRKKTVIKTTKKPSPFAY